MSSRSTPAIRRAMPDKLVRMYHHVLESAMDSGWSYPVAVELAARTVNKHRAKLAHGYYATEGRGKKKHRVWKRGPKLVTRGGTRTQWWPGKKVKKKVLYCIKHRRKFKSKAGLKSHYRGKQHRKVRTRKARKRSRA